MKMVCKSIKLLYNNGQRHFENSVNSINTIIPIIPILRKNSFNTYIPNHCECKSNKLSI